MALGSDSHTAFTMGEFEECLKILDAVDFPPERILNVSPRRLLNFLNLAVWHRLRNLQTFNY